MNPGQQGYDLIVRGVHLIDPAQGLDRVMDVAFRDGLVAEIAESIPGSPEASIIDGSGLFGCPGWIDLHTHVYPGVSHYGVWPDEACLPSGTTTVVDAGTAGAATFNGLRWFIIERSRTRVLAFLHISRIGLCLGLELNPPLGELCDLRLLSISEAIECIEQNRDVVVGIKVRLTDMIAEGGKNERAALEYARKVADETRLPLMVHFPNSSLALASILDSMKPGDVLTHCFHAHRCNILSDEGKVVPELKAAVKNGIRLDVGHGVGSFAYQIARAALEQGVRPYVISSDLHRYNLYGPVWDLAATLSKFLHLGLDLTDVIASATINPARVIGRQNEFGTLRPGSSGDMVLFSIESGKRALPDTIGQIEILEKWIKVEYVIRAGKLIREQRSDT